MRLSNKVAIVTGGGSGIGRGIAVAFAREEARVVIAGRHQDKLDIVAKEIGPACLAQAADVGDAKAIEKLIANTLRKFGGIHILVNNGAKIISSRQPACCVPAPQNLTPRMTGRKRSI